MAVSTGTSDSPSDLYAKLIDFLTTDATLSDRGELWRVSWQHTDGAEAGVVLSGPGISVDSEVHVGIHLTQNAVTEEHSLWLHGMTGVIPEAEKLALHVNTTPNLSRMFLAAQGMQYWFIANGRRFIVIVKISTVFEQCYCGLFLPYAKPVQYPYPMLVGGSCGDADLPGDDSWRSSHYGHAAYWRGDTDTTSVGRASVSSHVLTPEGSWAKALGAPSQYSETAFQVIYHPYKDYYRSRTMGGSADDISDDSDYSLGSTNVWGGAVSTEDGFYVTVPIHLIYKQDTDPRVLGVLDGVFWCQGYQNAAENVIEIDGVDHLVVQNTFRTGSLDYCCVALE